MMKGQLAGLMKQAQAMQDNMKKMQEQLASVEVEGQAGAGMVKVIMTCKNDVKRVAIDPSLLGDEKRHAGRLGRGGIQRRRAQGRGNITRKNGGSDCWPAAAARVQAAILMVARFLT